MSYQPFNSLKHWNNDLRQNTNQIEVQDLGAGSLTGLKHKRRVCDIHANAGKPRRIREFLFKLMNEIQAENVVELGTSLGVSSAYLASAHKQTRVYTIEGCKNTQAIALGGFKKLELNNVSPILGDFDVEFPKLIHGLKDLDVLFIDGNHTEEATLRYFSLGLEKMKTSGVVILDDIYWSTGMINAWEKIKAHRKVSLSLDFFVIGLVFFEQRSKKEHYKLKVPLKTFFD